MENTASRAVHKDCDLLRPEATPESGVASAKDGTDSLITNALLENSCHVSLYCSSHHHEDYAYGRLAWIMDPEGNRIELCEPPKTK